MFTNKRPPTTISNNVYLSFTKVVIFFLVLSFLLLFPKDILACRDCSDGAGCSSCGNGWFCSEGIHCCHCVCGGGTSADYGPVECFSEPDHDVYGCLPCVEPTSPPFDTPTPTQIPSPTTASFWLCRRPYASPSFRCSYDDFNCINPDVDGGYCYSARDNCEHGCRPAEGVEITPREAQDPLCTYAPGRYGINSAIGCFPVDDNNEATIFILRWALGVASGITFLLIIYSAFLIMGSGGNTEKVKSGKELLTAAITGLILIIFSVFILDLFGIRILRIPGL